MTQFRNKKPKPARPQPRVHNLGREFPQVKGRPGERIQLTTQSGYHAVTIRFQDNTDLEVRIHPALSFTAALYDWKSGSQRVLKRWPTIQAR